ncbi:MAG: DUF86 domain-containing protein [Deltaproteobacteria bacterium]|nr:DUF86 domain-containing protein [Deltaproteobacteria bacterium]
MTREGKLFIQDIHNAIRHIKKFVGDINFKEFLADEKTKSAVAFKIENIGEASKNIPRAIKTKYKEISWIDMARMRDKITHFYFGIDYKIVWKVVKEELPIMEPTIRKILRELKADEPTKKKP